MEPERWHSSIKIKADIYGHLVPGANRQEMNRLPSLKTTPAEPLTHEAS